MVTTDPSGSPSRPVIGISHVAEELAVAQTLAKWIAAAFPERCAVVLSSDTREMPTGGRWREEVDQTLAATRVLLVLCSPASLRRPWVGFEAGAAWMKRVPVLPICHAGQRAAKLPPPLWSFAPLETDVPTFATEFVARLAGHLQITTPRIDQAAMRADLDGAARGRQGGAPAQEAAAPASAQAEEGAAQLLRAIAANDDPGYMVDELAAACSLTTKQTQHYIDGLLEQKYLTRRMFTGKPAQYHLSSAGKKYLVDTGVLDEHGSARRRPR